MPWHDELNVEEVQEKRERKCKNTSPSVTIGAAPIPVTSCWNPFRLLLLVLWLLLLLFPSPVDALMSIGLISPLRVFENMFLVSLY